MTFLPAKRTAVDADYTPHTVNTDGWPATQGAWKALFPHITVILCFLHAFLKIRDRATKALHECFELVQTRVWEAYHAPSKRAFSQRLRRLREWAKTTLPDSVMKAHTLDLCDKREQFSRSYDHHEAHRTSNMVDRLMKFLDRACFHGQYFHGTFEAAENRVRALALLWNFCPSSPSTVTNITGKAVPLSGSTAGVMQRIAGESARLRLHERCRDGSTDSVITSHIQVPAQFRVCLFRG